MHYYVSGTIPQYPPNFQIGHNLIYASWWNIAYNRTIYETSTTNYINLAKGIFYNLTAFDEYSLICTIDKQMSKQRELTTDTKVALDISGISLGGGESPVRFKLGLKKEITKINTYS